MESLSDTPWDVVIVGTGLQQSLLALALSRSDKKILHLDENDYYGGPEAAFSLQEAEEWALKVNSGTSACTFVNASITKSEDESNNAEESAKLSFSRAYTLALSPQIIYSRSKLLSQLVSSKVYRQLEFQAVGNWWIYKAADTVDAPQTSASIPGTLQRLPNGREDVFSDRSIDVRAKRSLMKFLKFVANFEEHSDVWQPFAESSLPEFLSSQFQLPSNLQIFVIALTLSLLSPSETTVGYSLPRISRHLSSIGVFGPGFGAVIPKWGGASEIAQVACRAGAVGGGVYILGTGIAEVVSGESSSSLDITLSSGQQVSAPRLVQSQQAKAQTEPTSTRNVSKVIAIVSSDLSSLFVSTVEGAPTPAVSVVAFPSNTIQTDGHLHVQPVYIMVHSSETGECPIGQCVLYGTTSASKDSKALLNRAIRNLLAAVTTPTTDQAPATPKVLYTLHYEQSQLPAGPVSNVEGNSYEFPPSSTDLAFDDTALDNVEEVWRNVTGSGAHADQESQFMVFPERAGMEAEDEY